MEARGLEPGEIVSANKKLGRKDAEDLVRASSRIVASRGKKVSEHKGGKATADAVSALLGPTGNLRAPTLRAGKTLLVGFNEEAWTSFFD